MSFKDDFPFGIDLILLHPEGRSKAIVINPNDPASVYESVNHLMGRNIVKATFKATENPEYDAWREAVADRETMESFETWKEKRK